jgi:DNA-binding transcriptional ArsR family regulator
VQVVTTTAPYPRLDPVAVKILAHPLRSRLLGELRLNGPATATTLASVLGTNTGATSYHLRKLAAVGLVEETGEGKGRERWWRPAHEMHSWLASDLGNDPDGIAAAEWLHGESLRRFQLFAEEWFASEWDWPIEWRDAAGSSDFLLELSASQLRDLGKELTAVIERYRKLEAGPDPARVIFCTFAFPQPDGRI